MFVGLLIGTLCLIGLVRVVAGRRYYGFHHYAYAPGWGHHGPGWGPPGWGYGHGGPFGRRRHFLHSILARIDATPAQERAIMSALHELKDTARELRGTLRETRGDVAKAFREPSFDESSLGAADRRVEVAGQTLRRAVTAAIGKIHGVLDDRQRKVVGEMLEGGWAAYC
jgi:Spy/CpxP family protein refolding chaperone